MELSSEVPGTSADWPSDISVSINTKRVGTWTSPGDFGDKRGVYTPDWWKLKGSQYGKLKSWRVGANGTYVDGIKISDVTIERPRYRQLTTPSACGSGSKVMRNIPAASIFSARVSAITIRISCLRLHTKA
jgi:hypothetical protein